jgi:hypothetical protein
MVVWYAAHIEHPGNEAARVGPDLVAGHWQPKALPVPKLLEDDPPASE